MQSRTSLPKLLPMIAAWLVAFPTITALLVLLAPVVSLATPATLQLVRKVF